MAEQIISPGVFTRENDLSFLPAGVASIGAAVVGPTVKGPAFIPTVVTSFSDYERKFGTLSTDTYVPQTVREYLKNAGSVTVVRVLAGAGYSYTFGGADGKTSTVAVIAGGDNATTAVAATGSLSILDAHLSFTEDDEFQIVRDGITYRFISADPTGGIPNSGSIANGPWFFESASSTAISATSLSAAINFANSGSLIGIHTLSSSNGLEFTASVQGTTTPQGGTAGNSVVIKSGSATTFSTVLSMGGGIGASGTGGVLLGVLFPSKNSTGTPGLQHTALSQYEGTTLHLKNSFNVKFSGSNVTGTTLNEDIFSGSSVNPNNSNYIFDLLGHNADNSKNSATTYTGIPAYTYINFKNLTKEIQATGSAFPGYGVGTQFPGGGVFPYGDAIGSGSNLEFVTQSGDIKYQLLILMNLEILME
jgi:hypothetical protein